MKKEMRNAIIIAIAGAVVTAALALLGTASFWKLVWSILKWIWINIFEIEFKVWQILLGLGILALLIVIVNRIIRIPVLKHDFLNYTSDKFGAIKWKWRWWKNSFGKYQITDLRPKCPNCDTSIINWHKGGNMYVICPECEQPFVTHKSFEQVENLILDRVDRGLHKN